MDVQETNPAHHITGYKESPKITLENTCVSLIKGEEPTRGSDIR